MSKITWTLLDTWLSIAASVLSIITYFIGFFRGRNRGLEIAQEQNQEAMGGKQHQKQIMKF